PGIRPARGRGGVARRHGHAGARRRRSARAAPSRHPRSRTVVRARGRRRADLMSGMVSLDAVDALHTLLHTAVRLMDELRRQGLLERLVAVLGAMLPGDREAILRILEHDAGLRTHVDDANVWSRFLMRPNPFAQLYGRTSQAVQSLGVRYL